jgi:co-chaperonin GroES (HSP10)
VLSGNAVRPAYEYKNIEFPLLGSGGYFPALSLDELMSDKECVPVDPFPFVMNERGCKVLINGDPWSKAYLNASDLKVVGISDQFHSELEGAEIVGIGIIAQALEGNTVEYKLIIDDEISNNVYKNSYHHKDAEKYLVFIKTDLLKFNFNSLYIKTDKNVNFLKANSKENSPILIAFYYKK